MAIIKTLTRFILLIFCVIIAIVVIRTFTLQTHEMDILSCKKSDLDFIEAGHGSEALKRFRDAIRFKTVSTAISDYNTEELTQYVQYIISGLRFLFTDFTQSKIKS